MVNLQTMRYGNGVTNLYQYDSLNRLTNSVWKLNAGMLASFYYQLGLAGNRKSLMETNNGANRSYAWNYDPLYRLTNEIIGGASYTSPQSLGYGYDSVGNRTSRTNIAGSLNLTNQSFTFNTNDWLMTDQYDNNGNTINASGNTYQYDALNHVTNATVNSVTILMSYDGDGNRVKKTVGGTNIYYLVDDRNPSGYAQALEEWTASGGVTNLSRVYNYGLSLISHRTLNPQLSTNYFICDGHGSTRALYDGGGAFVNSFAYDAYGTLIASNATPQTAYLYSCQQFDFNMGLYLNRARYWNTGTGRFWTMDTYAGNNEDPLSLHKYLYCQDNPVNAADPSGKRAYVATRPLDMDFMQHFPRLMEHVFLAFDEYGLTDKKAWENLIASEDDPSKSANSYGITYTPDPELTTFSFHPRSVFTGNDSENTWETSYTPASYVSYNAQIDKDAFNTPGINEGYHLYLVADNDQTQQRLFKFAAASRNKNNNGTPDPCNYDFGRFNCGSWVDYILRNNGIDFPNRSINEGIGLGGTLSGAGKALSSAARGQTLIDTSAFSGVSFLYPGITFCLIMNRLKYIGNIAMILLLGATISLLWACRRSPAIGRAVTKVFENAGLQMETPVAPDFESTHSNRVLVMFHPFGGGLFTERNYRVQITVVRISKTDLDAKSQRAIGTYEFYEWYATNHPNLDIRKEGPFWHLRKDIQTPSGEYLYVDGQVQDFGSSETNLAQAKQTIESIKPLR